MDAAGRTRAEAPAPGLNGTALDALEALLHAVEAKDLPGLKALMADGAVLVDPHYPVPRMVGWRAISDGLGWSFGTIETFRFAIIHRSSGADGSHAAVEVGCDHVLRGGRHLVFHQVFVADVRDGRITRLQAYEPYGPGGLVGLVLRVTRFGRRVRHAASIS